MKIYGIIASKHSGPCYHRVFLPVKELALSHNVEYYFSNLLDPDKLEGVDIVLVNRAFPFNDLDQVIELRKQHGFKIVVDLDDFWQLDPSHIMYDYWTHNNLSKVIVDTLQAADCILVTNDALRSLFNIPVHVIPNAIPVTGQFTIYKTDWHVPRIFYQGSTTHVKDVQLLKNPLRRLMSNVKAQVNIAGWNEDIPEWHVIVSTLTNGLQYPTRVISGTTPDLYYKAYEHCDIAVVPLIDNTFNRYKSNLKILEAAHAGAPVVCSNVQPYFNHPVDYVNNQTDWYNHLKKLIDDKTYRQERGQQLKEYCQQHYNYNRINTERYQIFEHLISGS